MASIRRPMGRSETPACPFSHSTLNVMKVSQIKTYEQAINELKLIEMHGGVRRDTQNRIVPVSQNAKHIFAKARTLVPKGEQWKELSPEGASWEESRSHRETTKILSGFTDIRPRSHR